MKNNPPALLLALIIFSLFAMTWTKVFAYAVPAGGNTAPGPSLPSSATFDWAKMWQNFSSPFAGATKSIESIGGGGTGGVTVPGSVQLPQNVSDWLREAFNGFDAWLYGILGFHISAVFAVFLNILGWSLGIMKTIVDGLLSWFHI